MRLSRGKPKAAFEATRFNEAGCCQTINILALTSAARRRGYGFVQPGGVRLPFNEAVAYNTELLSLSKAGTSGQNTLVESHILQ